jgi:hypothetical protein
VADPADRPGEWLSLSRGAERLGWRQNRLRSLARRQDWPKRRGNVGGAFEYLIPAGLLAGPIAAPGVAEGLANGAAEADLVAELRDHVADLAARLGRAEGELTAEARRSTDLLGVITDLRADRDRLAAELALARKGWLERLIEAVRKK